jgi:hypothetical protein
VWKRLGHRFILPFLGIEIETFLRFPSMVSPWMRNGTILEYLERNGNIGIEERVRQLCRIFLDALTNLPR